MRHIYDYLIQFPTAGRIDHDKPTVGMLWRASSATHLTPLRALHAVPNFASHGFNTPPMVPQYFGDCVPVRVQSVLAAYNGKATPNAVSHRRGLL